MSIKKLKTTSGETKWEVRVYENGRGSKRISRKFDRKSDAEAFLDSQKRELIERKINPFKSIGFEDRTFRDEAENWLLSAEIRFSPGNLLRCRAVVRDLMPMYGDLLVARLTPEVITKFQRDEKAKGLEDATVNRKCQIILAILNYAVKQRRIPFNPAQGYTKLREAQKETEFWSTEEAISFLTLMNETYPRENPKRWVYVAYLLALNTGMRAAKIWGLKPEDLSPIANVITVRRQLNRISQKLAPTKSRRGRIVPCSSEVAEELRWLMQKNAERTVLEATATETPSRTIFRGEKEQPINHDNFISRVWEKDLKRWGGRPIRFHDLRHTATTLMIASGVAIKTLKEICGHADIATTINYVHLVSSAVERVPELFSLKPSG